MALSGSLVLLFLIASVVAILARRMRMPYTVALVVAGLAVGATGLITPPALTKELLFAVFLPGLLFEAAFQLEAEEFWRNRLTLFSLALPAVVVATGFIAAALVLGSRLVHADAPIAWGPAFVFATLIAATDPIAVVAIVRTLGAPARLGILIEGESLLNDGTAAVSFAIAVTYVMGGHTGALLLAGRFVYQIIVAVAIGGAIGLVAARLLKRLEDAMVMITVTTTAAYGSFILTDAIGASGVIAAVTAGLLAGTHAVQSAIADEQRNALHIFWDYAAFALNSLVFLLIGFQARIPALVAGWRAIVGAYVVVTIVRLVVTYAFAAAQPAKHRIPPRWTAVLAWSGLRGSLSMVLALSLPAAMPQRDLVVTMTVGVVVLSILIQGLTVSPLLERLGVSGLPRGGA